MARQPDGHLYSHFDTSQSEFNLRGTILTDEKGRYQFRSFIPVGYSVPPNGATDALLKQLGRHGSRPAHIHFFVSAPGYRKLTTQINIEDDPGSPAAFDLQGFSPAQRAANPNAVFSAVTI